ncbi:MAG: type II toxin-antitoxin system RelE/ParE family toxin, partial [Firmicutes bacterium]|nr:type II toxin-antitoxin system RelE/ParE family toxin [Bacillota bacterium]
FHVDDRFLRGKGYRKLIVDNYLVFYLVYKKEKQVIIMWVLYGRREYQGLL